jgi:hypothetical protein
MQVTWAQLRDPETYAAWLGDEGGKSLVPFSAHEQYQIERGGKGGESIGHMTGLSVSTVLLGKYGKVVPITGKVGGMLVGVGVGRVVGKRLGKRIAEMRITRSKVSDCAWDSFQAATWVAKMVEIGHRVHPKLRVYRVSESLDHPILWPVVYYLNGTVRLSGYQYERLIADGENLEGTDWKPCPKLGMEITGCYLDCVDDAMRGVKGGSELAQRLKGVRRWLIMFRKEMLIISAERLADWNINCRHLFLSKAIELYRLRKSGRAYTEKDEQNLERMVSTTSQRGILSLKDLSDESFMHKNWVAEFKDHCAYRAENHDDRDVLPELFIWETEK